MSYDDSAPPEERFGRRKDRRRPRGRRRVSDLEVTAEEARSSADRFDDPGLQTLHEAGLLDDLVRQVKSGKEATVYLARGPAGLLAAKIYSDIEVRAFRDNARYLEGRQVSGKRVRKALEASRRQGLDPELALWTFHEYRMLWELTDAGVRVPRPAVGPDAGDLLAAGRTVLMEWIGSEEEPAPRLADVTLEPDEARSAWEQSLELLRRLLERDIVHGDFSTYNLLWWQGEVVLIDLPQAVDLSRNRHAADLLERDVGSLCSSFRRLGIDADPARVLLELRLGAGFPPSGRLRR